MVHGLSCLLHGMWGLPGSLEPASPASAGRFFTTESPGKLCRQILNHQTAREVPDKISKAASRMDRKEEPQLPNDVCFECKGEGSDMDKSSNSFLDAAES